MPQILIRNVNQTTLEKLKERARRHKRSLQGEVSSILERAVRTDVSQFLEKAARLRERLAGRTFSDTTELIAEDRAR